MQALKTQVKHLQQEQDQHIKAGRVLLGWSSCHAILPVHLAVQLLQALSLAKRSCASLQAVRHPEDDAAFLQEQLQALLQVQHLQRDWHVPEKPACGLRSQMLDWRCCWCPACLGVAPLPKAPSVHSLLPAGSAAHWGCAGDMGAA